MIAVKFVEGTNDTIEGPGMPWGGPFNGQDLEGEHFSANTDFAFDLFPPDSRPLMYHHGLDKDAGVSAVGRVKSYEVKADLGVWTRAQLDRSSEYFDAIAELVSAGKLFFSSGAMAHLVKVNRKSGEILRWPWTELSLTPTPANLYATVSMLDATKHFEMAGLKAIWDEKESGLKAAISKERMQGLCAEMEVEMTPEEMQQMLSEMPDSDEEAMRACLSKRKGGKSAAGFPEVVSLLLDGTDLDVEAVPIASHAEATRTMAASLAERTKDLSQRRLKEGRVLSDANRQRLGSCVEQMRGVCDDMQALLDSTAPAPRSTEGSEKMANVRRLRAQLVAQQIGALTLN